MVGSSRVAVTMVAGRSSTSGPHSPTEIPTNGSLLVLRHRNVEVFGNHHEDDHRSQQDNDPACQ